MTKSIFRPQLLAGIAVIGSHSVPAFADTASAESSTNRHVASGAPVQAQLEEIVVTGQKREQTVAQTPATVTALSSDMLKRVSVVDLQSINRLVPGYRVEFTQGGTASFSVRGIGTTAVAQSFEQSVAPYINGVYLGGHNREFSWPLFDIQRIELYKGTQSGISGQNASAGVVNIVTTEPGTKFGGYVTAAGEAINGGYQAQGALDLPVAETLSLRVAGFLNQRGGWIKNVATGNDLGEQRNEAFRLIAKWTPTDSLNSTLYIEHDREKLIGATPQISDDPTGGYAAYVAPYFAWRRNLDKTAMRLANLDPSLGVTFDGDGGVLAHAWKGSLTLEYDLGGGYTLTSISAASKFKERLGIDQDNSPAALPTAAEPGQAQQILQTARYSQETQELRLASPTDDRFSFILGGWYRHAEYTKNSGIFVNQFLNGTARSGTIYLPFEQTTRNASVFGDVVYRITDTIKIGGSLRYTEDHKPSRIEGTGNPLAPFAAFPLFRTTLDHEFVDGSVRLQYQPSRNLNFYALYSHGTKTGALVDLVTSGRPQIAKPEVIETYEVGAKLNFPEAWFSIDVSAFHMPITDYQDSFTQNVGGSVLFVAANTSARTDGFDLSLQWVPTTALTVNGSVEYLQARDLTNGGQFVRSPKWSATGQIRYEREIGSSTGAVFVNGLYSDSYFSVPRPDPNRLQGITPAYATFDAGVEFLMPGGLDLQVLCKNCTNKYVYARGATGAFGPARAPTIYHYIPELRTLMFQVTKKF